LHKIYAEELEIKESEDKITIESTFGDETMSWSVATLDGPPLLRPLAFAAP
jgi:hypothetical protein